MKDNTDNHYYQTITQAATAEFRDRGSKFIAYAYPLESTDEFKKILQALKKEHPKAVHHCFAYRLGTDGNSFRSSDDGEPAGSAGKPILGQIDSRELTNVLVVVVRYFGGTLLGVPGLVNAYKTSTSLALQITPQVRRSIEKKYLVEFDYNRVNEVLTILKQYSCTIITQELQLFCRIVTGIPVSRLEEVLYKLKDLPQVKLGSAE